MRKIYLFITLFLFVLVGNYFVWLWESRTITETLNELKRKLGYNNIEMTYGDIKFNTFQSWQVNGQLIDLKVTYGDKTKREILFPKIKFEARPFSKKIKLYPSDSLIYKTINKSHVEEYSINAENISDVILEMKLDISFSEMLEYMRSSNSPKPAYVFISKVNLTSPKVQVMERKDGLKILDIDLLEAGYYTDSEELSNSFVFKSHVDNIVYSEEYIEKQKLSGNVASLNKKYGVGNVNLDFTLKKSPSKDQLEFLAKHKDKNIVPVFDLITISFDNIEFKTATYDLKVEGFLEKYPYSMIPDAKVKMIVDDVDAMLDTQLELFEESYNKVKLENPFLPLPHLDNSKLEGIKKYFKSLTKTSEGYSVLEVNKSKDEEMRIGNKSVFEFTAELQNLLFSSEQPKKTK